MKKTAKTKPTTKPAAISPDPEFLKEHAGCIKNTKDKMLSLGCVMLGDDRLCPACTEVMHIAMARVDERRQYQLPAPEPGQAMEELKEMIQARIAGRLTPDETNTALVESLAMICALNICHNLEDEQERNQNPAGHLLNIIGAAIQKAKDSGMPVEVHVASARH